MRQLKTLMSQNICSSTKDIVIVESTRLIKVTRRRSLSILASIVDICRFKYSIFLERFLALD